MNGRNVPRVSCECPTARGQKAPSAILGAVIVRVLRAQIRPGREDQYLQLLRRDGLPLLRAAAAIDVEVGTPTSYSPHEFLVTTRWATIEHLQAFAGPRWYRARILPGEADLLRSIAVHHYEVHPGLPDGPPSARSPEAPPPPGAGIIEAGPLTVDLLRSVAFLDGTLVELPPREFLVLAELARRPREPLSAEELASVVWPDRSWGTADDVRRIVYRLRRKLDGNGHRSLIRNRRGFGYLLDIGQELVSPNGAR